MLHAGVLMKLGGYGCFRIAMFLLPEAAHAALLDLPDPNDHLRCLRSPFRLCSDRLEVYQRLLFGEPLRYGALRPVDDDADRLHGCYPSDALSWFDDGPLLCAVIGMIYHRCGTRDVRRWEV
jgi:NADH-quinone oxidoreductase subunit M